MKRILAGIALSLLTRASSSAQQNSLANPTIPVRSEVRSAAVTVLASDGKPLAGASVRIRYPEAAVQQAKTDSKGQASFWLPVDASLASLDIFATDHLPWSRSFVQWNFSEATASTTVRLLGPPPYHVVIRAWDCQGVFLHRCSPALASVRVSRRSDLAPSDSPLLKERVAPFTPVTLSFQQGVVSTSIPFYPTEALIEVFYAKGSVERILSPAFTVVNGSLELIVQNWSYK